MTKPVSIIFYSGFIIILLGILSPLIVEQFKPSTPLPQLGEGPEFVLTNTANSDFGSEQLNDKVWVASFFFSRCEGPCPMLIANVAKLASEFKYNQRVALASISVDPEYDTPKVLKEYAAKFHADPRSWHFLTGEKEKIVEILNEGLKIGTLKDPKYHTTYLVLLDKENNIRGYYDGTDSEMIDILAADIKKLL